MIWNADLDKKKGTKMVNPLPSMAKAYDELDGAGKARFQENIQSMAAFVTRALPGTPFEGKTTGTKTIAGESCDREAVRRLHLLHHGQGAGRALQRGVDVLRQLRADRHQRVALHRCNAASSRPRASSGPRTSTGPRADSSARAWIQQLASKELADSLAAAKAKAKEAGAGEGEMTPEQQKQMCDALKNFDLGKAMSNAFKNAMADAGKNALKSGLRGLIKRP